MSPIEPQFITEPDLPAIPIRCGWAPFFRDSQSGERAHTPRIGREFPRANKGVWNQR